MQLGGLERASSSENVLFRQSRQIGDLLISVRSASWFFCLGIVFPSQYRPGGTGRIRNGFYRSKNSYLIHHNIVFSAWQIVLKSAIQVNRQLDVSGGFRTWLSASF
jgi:hypothetical protein